MWPRKQLDISGGDLAFGLLQALTAHSRPTDRDVVGTGWVPADEAIVTLSVRSGFDLLLSALALPAGSELIVSAVTIPDMVRIIEHHGLIAVPADVGTADLQVDVDQFERLVTPQTRAILVAHLFGSRMEMAPVVEFARRHNLLVIEDCAQAFIGSGYAGHPDSDCALFSFGPIKTATALGGAIVRGRNRALRSRMIELHRAYPLQSRASYARRLLKYVGFCALCHPWVYGTVVRVLSALGIDYDESLSNAARSFAADAFFTQIRRQPCTPLVRMLQRRITTFDRRGTKRLLRRASRGTELSRALPSEMAIGAQNATHTYWVVPIRVGNREAVIAAVRAAGFDGTRRSSLAVIADRSDAPPRDVPLAVWLGDIVFMPCGEDIPDRQWRRLISLVGEIAAVPSSTRPRELVSSVGVSAAL